MNPLTLDPLPTTDAEWEATGFFRFNSVDIPQKISYARTVGNHSTLLAMVGGIPRDPNRRAILPVVPKLFGLLAYELQSEEHTSLLYHQPGLGASGGDFATETLASRARTLTELVKIFECETKSSQAIIFGSSAGAYMALRAARRLQFDGAVVPKVVLLAPPAFPPTIDSVPYGPEFTKIVRTPWDFATAPIFDDLVAYVESGGSVLVVYAEYDENIPRKIQQLYQSHVVRLREQGKPVAYWRIPGVTHYLRPPDGTVGYAESNDGCVRTVVSKLRDFITGKNSF
ncbi:MAG: alpha/beta hydrolase [Patescibacteria group bacterium]